MTTGAALDRPRFNILGGRPDGDLEVEDDISEATCDELEKRGHVVQRIGGWGRVQFGRGQIIRRDATGVLWGGSDPRADGCAMSL